MEEIFSILILVLWILFSIFNKNRKKKIEPATTKPLKQNESKESGQKARSILEQILLGEEPEPVPYGEYDETDNIKFSETYDEMDEVPGDAAKLTDAEISEKYDFDPDNEGAAFSRNHENLNSLQEEEHTERGIEFNLRQAVIFSEILRRPYAN